MKNSILLSIVLLCSACFCYAQGDKLELGIIAGPGLATQTGGYMAGATNPFLISYSVGLTGQYNFTSKFAIRSGIIFEQKGHYNTVLFTDSLGRPNGSEIIDNDLFDYLIVPVLAKYTFAGSASFFINAGPYFGYLLNETDIISFKDNKTPYMHAANYTKNNTRLDIGLSLGLGMEKQLNQRFKLEIELRDNPGLIAVIPPNQLFNSGVYNDTINLSLGLSYGLF